MKKKLLVFAALLLLVLACASVAFAKDVADGAMVTVDEVKDITSVGGIAVPPVTEENWDWHQTCEGSGRLHFFVKVDGTTYTYFVYVKPDGHTWSSTLTPEWGVVTIKPTCSTKGEATDQCVVCLKLDPTHTRPIDETPHEYDDPSVKYPDAHIITPFYKEPGCGEGDTGLAQHACILCGTAKPNEKEADMVVIPKIPHDWSEWRILPDSTCAVYGEAARTCIRCKSTQYLDATHTVWDQGKEYKIGDIAPLKNKDWNTATAGMNGKVYTRQSDLNAAIDGLKCEKTIKKNWLKDCYTREITYACPHCLGEEIVTDVEKGTKAVVHQPFTVTLKYPATLAHDWCEEPEEFGAKPGVPEDGKSLAPTCTKEGYYLYLCKHDAKHVTVAGLYSHGHNNEDQYKKVPIKATGHDWSEWFPVDMFKKGDDWYLVSYRYCKNCGSNETTNEKYEEPEVKQGLVKDEDGVWRYYRDGKVDTNFTKLVPFQGGEFWVVNGVVPNSANGMVICPDGKAYFLAQGQVQRVTQWAEYNGEWFVLINGELAKATGLLPYDGSWFAVESGRKLHVNGLWQDPNTGVWTYMADGQLQDYTGTVTYDGATFNVVHGYLAD